MALPKLRYTGLPPARAFAFPTTVATNTVVIATGGGVIFGWQVEETTGLAGARLVIGDGAAAPINVAAPITLQASESTRDFLPSGGWLVQQGIALTVTAGSVAGLVFAVLLPPDQVDALSDPLRADYD